MRHRLRDVAALLVASVVASAALGAGATPPSQPTEAGGFSLIEQARAYEHGEGVRKDTTRAAALYCEAARAGDAEGQYSLGWMYANGRGVPRDDVRAATMFRLAAAAGHVQAQNALELVKGAQYELPECMSPPRTAAAAVGAPDAPEANDRSIDDPDTFADLPIWKRKIAEVVAGLAPRYAIHPRLALAVIAVESNFDPLARSEKDARGLMQLMPETAARFGVRNRYDVQDNVRGGLAYLQWLLAYYRGDVRLAVAAYNAGEGAVDRYRGIPPYDETRAYVRRVRGFFGLDRHPYDSRIAEPSPIVMPDEVIGAR